MCLRHTATRGVPEFDYFSFIYFHLNILFFSCLDLYGEGTDFGKVSKDVENLRWNVCSDPTIFEGVGSMVEKDRECGDPSWMKS